MIRFVVPAALALLAIAALVLLPTSTLTALQPPPKVAAISQAATSVDALKVAKGFHVELLYSVPKDVQGSWVNLCVDPKGRLIVSDQYGSLYRVTVPPVGTKGDVKLEKIIADIGSAQGLLWAFDSLYVVVNSGQRKSGLYRVTDSNNDDMLDTVQLLREIGGGGGEHGPHAVLLNPDGKGLTVVCGNQSKLTELTASKVPLNWGEDHLLPRLPDGNGFMKGVLAPGGCIYTVTPDGQSWTLQSIGYRNQYDAAYNRDGDLFTYDADMEWDANTPWYRPTRVCHAVSGSDWGWRNGAGKYPTHYVDTLPPVVNVGPGSPTGVCFGFGAKFPAKYQDAFFICDWSYGKLYAVHMKPTGSTYTGELEELVAGSPLPLTDVIVNPHDGAMYFTIGGRKTQSGLYRVTYTGKDENVDPKTRIIPRGSRPERVRDRIEETFHGKPLADGAGKLFPALKHEDRFVRNAARIGLEWQPVDTWREKALAETDPNTVILSLLALTRVSAPDPWHRKPNDPPVDPALRGKILESLGRIDFAKLSVQQKLDLARVYQIALNRLGEPTADERKALLAKLNAVFPSGNRFLDGLILEILVFLQDDTVAPKALKLLAESPTQEEQLEYVRSLRMLKTGWTPELRKQYFAWFVKAGGYKGGNSFQGFLRLIKADAVALLTPDELTTLKPILEAKPATTVATAPPRPFVKKWTLDELAPVLDKGLKAGGRDFDRGRKLFGAANCFSCHRYDNEGGSAGPDLTGVAGRFSTRDLLESLLDPNKEISDQYAAVEIDTLDGKKVVGRIVNLSGDNLMVNTDMLNPNGLVTVNRNNVDAIKPSKLSMMPSGLLDTLNAEEAVDLMAYLLARGDRSAAVFKK